jgi:hypothetical protein
MADIFSNLPGIVAVVGARGANNPLRISIDDFPETGQQGGAVLTEIAVNRNGNYQFLHTMQDVVHVYSFGERIGDFRAAGLALARTCDGVEGLTTVLEYYEQNRLERRSRPISLVIGTSGSGRFRGFLTGVHVDIARPEAAVTQFGLQFHTLPSSRP